MNKQIFVTKSTLPPMEEFVEEIKEIWDNSWLTNMGPKHNELEVLLKAYLHSSNVSLFTNGHMALELLLQAMNLKGEVITSPFTFASTTHAIVRNGLTPVFCDIRHDNFTIDVDKIEELITPMTVAILPVHVYGNVCDVDRIDEIARKHHLKVVYDAAHAFGVEYNGKGIAEYGDASMFSFHATKVFNTIEGGAICLKDSTYMKALYQLKNFGIKNQEEVDGVGANAKMNEFQAAMGICNLRHIEDKIKKRKQVVETYLELLEDIPGIYTYRIPDNIKSNYSYFPIYVDKETYGYDRDCLYSKLEEKDIYARKYFYPLTSQFSCYDGLFDVSNTPIALDSSRNILTLPLYPDLSLSDVEDICQIIRNGCGNKYICK